MKISIQSHSPKTLSSPSPHSQKPHFGKPHNSKIRLKKRVGSGGGGGGKRGGPATPLLKWKFNDEEDGEETAGEDRGKCCRKVGEDLVSARKLAAGLWQLQLPEFDGDGKNKVDDLVEFEPGEVLVDVPVLSHRRSGKYYTEGKDLVQRSLAVSSPKNGIMYKVEPSEPFLISASEHATKWDSGCLKPSDEVYRFYTHMKLLEDQKIASTSVVSSLERELEQARNRIHELETERHSSKKKVEYFIRKLDDEKISWQRRELEKMHALIDDAKDDLKRERRNCRRMEMVNSKLVNELTEAKLSAQQIMKNYEKERKERVLMEEVCDELANELGEHKAEIEKLKRGSLKMREEVEEERKMLQIAEVWREERVQMKLMDAKLILEEKYSQLDKLIVDIEAFLRLRGITQDMMQTSEVKLFQDAVNSMNVPVEFSYKPPKPEDIFSVFEELGEPKEREIESCRDYIHSGNESGEPNEREIESCLDYAHSRLSKTQTLTSEVKEFVENSDHIYTNGLFDQNRPIKEDWSGMNTLINTEEQGSSFSPEGSNPSVNKNKRDSNVSGSLTRWEEIAETPLTEISEICSVSEGRLKKSSSISRLWRSNTINGENYRANGRLSNGEIISADEGGRSSADLDWWSSPDPGNPHIARGRKGCIEWPRGVQKNTLKAKLLEARMESKKIQLRHVLK